MTTWAGIVDGGELFPHSAKGTPQGGVVSPLLANVALHGLEEHIKAAFPKRRGGESWLPHVVRYADDFVVLHQDLAAVERTRRLAEEWLAGMGLELEPSKTRISHTLHEHEPGNNVGFDFLGFEFRQFAAGKTHSGKSPRGELLGCSTIVKPSKEAQGKHQAAVKEIVDAHKAAPQAALITRLNPVIRGWANYYRPANAAKIFNRRTT